MCAARALPHSSCKHWCANLHVADVALLRRSVAPKVVRNDEADWPQLSRRLVAGEFDNIVISPGPGTPERAADIGGSKCRISGAEWLSFVDEKPLL